MGAFIWQVQKTEATAPGRPLDIPIQTSQCAKWRARVERLNGKAPSMEAFETRTGLRNWSSLPMEIQWRRALRLMIPDISAAWRNWPLGMDECCGSIERVMHLSISSMARWLW